jgi:hypothetical protein
MNSPGPVLAQVGPLLKESARARARAGGFPQRPPIAWIIR